jgi:hypothetical protein
VSDNHALLLQSENLYMKLKIEKLKLELESEKIRSRHFEGLSQIALLELKRGILVNSDVRRNQVLTALSEIEKLKVGLIDSVRKLDEFVSVFQNALE